MNALLIMHLQPGHVLNYQRPKDVDSSFIDRCHRNKRGLARFPEAWIPAVPAVRADRGLVFVAIDKKLIASLVFKGAAFHPRPKVVVFPAV